MRLFTATLLAAILFCGSLSAQSNPFTGGPSGDRPAAAAESAPREMSAPSFSFRLPFQDELRGIQRRLNDGLSGFIRNLRDKPSPALLFLILGVSFLYGMIHALLPGHRKVVLFGYFLAENARPLQGLIAGILMAALHAGSALIIIGSVYLLVRGAATISGSIDSVNGFINTFSAWLLLSAGAFLLVVKLRALITGGHGGCGHDHGGRNRRMLPFIIFSGLIPCPGASMLLVFSLSLGVFYVGVLSVVSMSAGMGVTLAAVSVATILFKEKATAFFSGNFGRRLHTSMEIGGAAFLFLFGLWLVVFMPPPG